MVIHDLNDLWWFYDDFWWTMVIYDDPMMILWCFGPRFFILTEEMAERMTGRERARIHGPAWWSSVGGRATASLIRSWHLYQGKKQLSIVCSPASTKMWLYLISDCGLLYQFQMPFHRWKLARNHKISIFSDIPTCWRHNLVNPAVDLASEDMARWLAESCGDSLRKNIWEWVQPLLNYGLPYHWGNKHPAIPAIT
jgi:hypothetical protein